MSEKQTLQIGKGKPGPGRPKGVPNKANGLLRDAILLALHEAHPEGGVGYLKKQADENPVAFMGLIGKVLPMQVQGPGDDGEHLVKVSADEAFGRIAARLAGVAARTADGTDSAE